MYSPPSLYYTEDRLSGSGLIQLPLQLPLQSGSLQRGIAHGVKDRVQQGKRVRVLKSVLRTSGAAFHEPERDSGEQKK